MKKCSRCGEEKPLDLFHKYAKSKDGFKPSCKVCRNAEGRGYHSTHKAEHAVRVKAYYTAHRDELLSRQRALYAIDPKSRVAYIKEWASNNRDRGSLAVRNWQKRNPGWMQAYSAKKRARKLQRTPQWLTDDHWSQIAHIYAERPDGHHVDHIVPLCGKTVSGLHVPWNLQYLAAADNIAKSNKFDDQ